MEVVLREGNLFVVKWNEVFYLVNLNTQAALRANPPHIPDMFLRFVHFEQSIDNIPAEIIEQIKQILLNRVILVSGRSEE